MFRNRKFKTILVVALLLIVSTVAQASGFNYHQNTYRVNHKFYDERTNRTYDYNWEVSFRPAKSGSAHQNPKPSLPEKENKPNKPEAKPELPKEEGKPNIPNNQDKPNRPVEPEVPELPDNNDNPGKPMEPNKPSIPNNNGNLSQIELEVIRLINAERQKQGLSQFKTSSELSNVARVKSQDMSINNYFSHQSPKYGSPFDMLKSFGIKYSTAGENIAKGYNSAQSVVNGWMNSSGHRANILNPSFNTIGVGAYTDSSGTIYWTQLFTN